MKSDKNCLINVVYFAQIVSKKLIFQARPDSAHALTYWKIWNQRVQKLNTEKIAFKVPNEVLSNAYY